MATVTETLDLPAGGTPEVTVTIELVGTGGHPVRGFVTGTSTIVGKLTPTLTAGAWSAVLVANDSITPANTVYKRSVNGRGYSAVDYFEVPTGSSSHTLFSLLTDPPGALTPSGLAAHIADEGMGGHLPLGGTEDQVPVVQADGSVAWEDPAAGGVESVDGATGAVVLTGTYLQLPTGTKAAGKVPVATGTGATDHAWTALAKGDVGLGNVDNTSDANKPISTATQTALDAKASAAGLASEITNRVADVDAEEARALAAEALLAPKASPTFTGLPVAPQWKATGVTGANTTPLTLSGANASGAPASGAHVKGEIAGDDTGKLWYCTVAGTPGTWVAIGGDIPVAAGYKSGVYYSEGNQSGSNSSTNNELTAMGFTVAKTTTWDRIAIAINSGGAGSVFRLGIYADNGNRAPGALLLDAGTVATTAGGLAAITISQQLTAGLWWIAAVQQGGTSPGVMLQTNVRGHQGNGNSGFFQFNGGYTQAGVSGALPANFTTTPGNNNNFHTLLRAA